VSNAREYKSSEEDDVLRTAATALIGLLLANAPVLAQSVPPPPAVDVTAANIKDFIDKLPKDRISDLPIRIADVGGYKVGLYGVFRPKSMPGGAIRHQTSVTEIYYMLEGTGTLVTGGNITAEKSTGNSPNTKRPNFGGTGIEGGMTRKVVPGDVVIIPGNMPHWWSSLDSDIRYLIFRPDPEGLQSVR
jgi:hypothetical protein